jgi:hypothetical protein
MRGNYERRRLIGGLAVGLLLAQIVGCSSCVADEKKDEPVVHAGKPLGARASKITDKRPGLVVDEAGADASPAAH